MKPIKIKAARTSKTVAKVAGLLFCTSLFGLTLAPPSVAGELKFEIAGHTICIELNCFNNNTIIIQNSSEDKSSSDKDKSSSDKDKPPSDKKKPSDKPYPDAPGGPEPLTILGSAMGAGGLIWLKKHRSEKDRFSKGESLL